MNSQQTIIWQALADQTTEHLTITTGNSYGASGMITGLSEGIPIRTSYEIDLDKSWNVKRVKVNRPDHPTFHFTQNENGWYDEEGNAMPSFAGCKEVDLNLTPFTNTIPIRRLRPAQGTAVDITVMYFDLLGWSIKPVPQRYTSKGHNKYFFESFDTGFTSTITVDDDGIVIDYPGLWRRIYAMKE